jgi:hypothetical protein
MDRGRTPALQATTRALAHDKMSKSYLGTTDLGNYFIFQYVIRSEREKTAHWTLCFL